MAVVSASVSQCGLNGHTKEESYENLSDLVSALGEKEFVVVPAIFS